jgi:hypothetical protein
MRRGPSLLLPVLGLAAALAGCADGNPVRDLAVASGVTGGEPRAAPDFVSRSRATSVDYTPVGLSAPPRSTRVKDSAAVTSAEKEMNALQARTEQRAAGARRAAASPAAAPVRPPAVD